MMRDTGEWDGSTPFDAVFIQFLSELFPAMSQEERDLFEVITRTFQAKKFDGVVITLKEVSFIKLFCDAYFLRTARPTTMKAARIDLHGQQSEAVPATAST
jgi:hypothetical protein